MKNLTENAKKFLSKNPTLLGCYNAYRFYECPIHGDESDIKVITREGKYKRTGCYDMDAVIDAVNNGHYF